MQPGTQQCVGIVSMRKFVLKQSPFSNQSKSWVVHIVIQFFSVDFSNSKRYKGCNNKTPKLWQVDRSIRERCLFWSGLWCLVSMHSLPVFKLRSHCAAIFESRVLHVSRGDSRCCPPVEAPSSVWYEESCQGNSFRFAAMYIAIKFCFFCKNIFVTNKNII